MLFQSTDSTIARFSLLTNATIKGVNPESFIILGSALFYASLPKVEQSFCGTVEVESELVEVLIYQVQNGVSVGVLGVNILVGREHLRDQDVVRHPS